MPSPCFCSVTDAEGNLLTEGAYTAESIGEGYIEGHEDEFIVQAIHHQMTVPRDPQSGQPAGRRVHQPLTLTKYVDKSSPILAEALSQGRRLESVELKMYRTSSMGTEEHYFTILLEDAILIDITLDMPNALDPDMRQYGHMERVSFSYRRIEWTHEIAATTGEDDWRVGSE
ncbi:MAG: Hcp family type VI secretion system effector [Gammaproteobacteria bacterium]|nr:Hcp family type VI secretion system effector [Gammaproteobacteria bacterium]